MIGKKKFLRDEFIMWVNGLKTTCTIAMHCVK